MTVLRFLIALSIPLLFCAFVALFYRPENTYLNHLMIDRVGEGFVATRYWWQKSMPLSAFLIYSLPGGLWVLVLSLLGWRLKVLGFHLFFLGIIFGLGFEFVQITGLTDGTFDWLDIVAVLIGFGLSIWCTLYWLPDGWRSDRGVWRYVLFFTVFFAAFGADVF